MVTSTDILFSKFKAQESEELCRLLCSVFDTTSEELRKLYQDIDNTFEQPGYPLHFVHRDFFKPVSDEFRATYQRSPVIAVDLPSLMELNDGGNDKPTVAIISQDPKNNSDHEQVVVGTPYGLHHKGSRKELRRTKLYFQMVQVLLKLGYRVYLTDLLKIWVCNPERRYVGIKLPGADQQRFLQLIKPELDIVQPVAVITWGKVAGNAVNQLQLSIKHLEFIHPSGAAGGAWLKLLGHSPSNSNKLAYWRTAITQELGELVHLTI
jgi:uracil-DNA glycosylase